MLPTPYGGALSSSVGYTGKACMHICRHAGIHSINEGNSWYTADASLIKFSNACPCEKMYVYRGTWLEILRGIKVHGSQLWRKTSNVVVIWSMHHIKCKSTRGHMFSVPEEERNIILVDCTLYSSVPIYSRLRIYVLLIHSLKLLSCFSSATWCFLDILLSIVI